MGHMHTSCSNRPVDLESKRKRPATAANTAAYPMRRQFTAVAANVTADDEDEELTSMNMVSVAFGKIEEFPVWSLFDTGSPCSFIRKSTIPFNFLCRHKKTRLRGLGGHRLDVLGELTCRLKFAGREANVTLSILPDDAISLPCVLGRDFLQLFTIKLMKPKCPPNCKLNMSKDEFDHCSHFCAPTAPI